MTTRVLAIHGLNDNAASFDQLVPLLGDQLCVICVDLPGHGLSSHLPAGFLYSILDYVLALKRFVDHIQWSQFSILAHSLGTHISVYFTAVFHQSVSRLLLIDAFFANLILEEDFILDRCQVMFDKLFNTENVARKIYQYEESLKRLSEERQAVLGIPHILPLHKRAYSETKGGFVYNNDPRIKLLAYSLTTTNFHLGLIKRINCRLLIISTSKFEEYMLTPATKSTLAALVHALGWKMKVVRVQGSHDIHMDNPQAVVPIIKQFLIYHNSRL